MTTLNQYSDSNKAPRYETNKITKSIQETIERVHPALCAIVIQFKFLYMFQETYSYNFKVNFPSV